jgi:DNA-binding NarL/FixJ family response regulator
LAEGQNDRTAAVTVGHRGTVALIDPRALTRQCLARWLEACGLGFEVVAVASLAQIDRHLDDGGDIDLVLLSIGSAMVTDREVHDLLGCLRDRLPEAPSIILSDREDVEAVRAAIRAGVRGYIPTTFNLPVAVEALRLVQVGGTFVPATSVMNALEDGERREGGTVANGGGTLPNLTPRQSEVLHLLRQGKSNKIIAYELEMQESTVKVHIRHIMRKLKATNRTQVAFLAQQLLNGGPTNPVSTASLAGAALSGA